MKSSALITCNALAHILTPLVDPDTLVVQLDINLHVSPDRLRTRLLHEIALIERAGLDILLGYGLCGMGTKGLVSKKSRLVLPRVDDCIGALLGSRERHQEMLRTCPGCYFLEPSWLHTELNIFEEILKGLERFPQKSRNTIIKMALKHYNTLALLSQNADTASPAWSQCEQYSKLYQLKLIKLTTDHSLLRRLVSRQWEPADFLVMEPGEPIPLF
ncbi:MAG: DUF1638 domain-containing protein [Desulfobacteraceae bacterium]|jgi:hypothetical protein